MRNNDYDHLKPWVDQLHSTGTTTLSDSVWGQSSSVYRDPDRLAHEQIDLFDRYPLVAASSGEMPETGSYVARDLVGTPIVMIRQADGSVRAFLNACRHRGTELVWGGGTGCAQRLRCRYHGWTYGPDGRLVGVTTPDGFSEVAIDDLGLVELGCAERHGLVWVTRAPGAPLNLDRFLPSGLRAELDAVGLGSFAFERNLELHPEVNWKLIMDGFLENYHVRYLHAQTLNNFAQSDRMAFTPFGPHLRYVVPRRDYDPDSHESPEDFLAQTINLYLLFPNTVVVWATDHFELWQIEPDVVRPDLTHARVSLLVPPDSLDQADVWAENLRFTEKVILAEDFAAAASAQRTLSGAAAPKEFLYGRNEPALQHFHQRIAAVLASDGALPTTLRAVAGQV